METDNTYGWGTTGSGIDTHLMKNIEWGAIAYFSKSAFGQNTNEVWINPSYTTATIDTTTGCAGDSVSASRTEGCLRTYDTANGVKASTTGTIYGIYDMSGGNYEYIAAYVNNGDSILTTYGSSLISAGAQYKDVYTVGGTDDEPTNYGLTINKKGDAFYETSSSVITPYVNSWFDDFSHAPYANYPLIMRGGYNASNTGAGLFSAYYAIGNPMNGYGFRPVLAVNASL
jgi:hypothetical protein